jgi:chemotaxis protein histidine kinase CheA
MSASLAKQIIFSLLGLFSFSKLIAQNITGFTILVGADAPAFIIFHSEVKNAEFLTPGANNYYTNKVRNNNSLSISYKKDSKTIPDNVQLTVQEGNRSHVFVISFKKNYNINRDPSLSYDYSDLKSLKGLVEERGRLNQAELQRLAEEDVRKKEASSITEVENSRKKQRDNKEKEKQDLEKAKKLEADKQVQLDKELAKAKEDEKRKADEIKKAQALASQKEKDRKKAEDLVKQKQAEREEADKLAKQKASEKQKADALAKEEARLKEEERTKAEALQKARLDEERRKKEHEDALALAKKLEDEKKQKEEANKYTRVGLWKRYGSKGVNVFDLPPKQVDLVNAEFFLEKDTLRNYTFSQEIVNDKKPRLNIASEKTTGGVSLNLESISFNGANVYFKILISNKSQDDFLMGLTGIYWYLSDGSPKMWLNCSYITYIQNFPIVPPGKETHIVIVTRDANIQDNEMLDITMNERRPDKERLEIRLEGKEYNSEKMKIEREVKKKKNKKRK